MAYHLDTSFRYDSASEAHPFIVEFKELLQYQYFLWNLVRKDVALRYKRTWLGTFWVMLNPLLTAVVLVVVFSAQFRSQIDYFAIYVLSGLVVWNLFVEASTGSMVSLLDHAHIIGKVYAPPSVFVVAAIVSATIIHAFDLFPLLLLAILQGVPIQPGWLLLPIPMLQTALFACGIGLLLSSFVVYFSDIINFYQVIVRIGFFVTPIFYPIEGFDPVVTLINNLNPLTHLISSFRSLLFDGYLSLTDHVLPSTLVVVVTLLLGWYVFTRTRRDFAYRV